MREPRFELATLRVEGRQKQLPHRPLTTCCIAPLPFIRCDARQSDSAFVADLCGASLRCYKDEAERVHAIASLLKSYLGVTLDPAVVGHNETGGLTDRRLAESTQQRY